MGSFVYPSETLAKEGLLANLAVRIRQAAAKLFLKTLSFFDSCVSFSTEEENQSQSQQYDKVSDDVRINYSPPECG